MNKDEFIEKSLKANEEEASKASLYSLTDKNSSVYEGIKVPPQIKESGIPQKPKVDSEGLPVIPQIRTYTSDVSDAVKEQELSMVKIATKEALRQEEGPQKPDSGNSYKYILYIVFLLTLLGGGAYGYFYFINLQKEKEVVVEVPEKDIVYTETKSSIDLKNATLGSFTENLQAQINANEAPGFKKIDLEISGTKIKTLEFIDFIQGRIPKKLERSLYEKFYLGTYYLEKEKMPFLMLFTTNNEIAFSEMLEWEKTLVYDLKPIFGYGSSDNFETPEFVDLLLENIDVRIVGMEGKTLFFYTIIDNNIILFAKDQNTLREVLRRLRENKITK